MKWVQFPSAWELPAITARERSSRITQVEAPTPSDKLLLQNPGRASSGFISTEALWQLLPGIARRIIGAGRIHRQLADLSIEGGGC